jgi:hypothetical protein
MKINNYINLNDMLCAVVRCSHENEPNKPITGCHKIRKQYIKFEVFMAMTMKNGVFWDTVKCGSMLRLLLLTLLRAHQFLSPL